MTQRPKFVLITIMKTWQPRIEDTFGSFFSVFALFWPEKKISSKMNRTVATQKQAV